jgi:hypothetical protein
MGTGTTSDTYDQPDRLTEAKDGHGRSANTNTISPISTAAPDLR